MDGRQDAEVVLQLEIEDTHLQDQALQSSWSGQTWLIAAYCFGSVGINVFMKYVLSHLPLRATCTATSSQVLGLPAPFFWTMTQQVVAFSCSLFAMVLHRFSRGRIGYWPSKLQSSRHVCVLALCFALSIGLNNFSLSLVSLNINTIIKATSPLVTAAAGVLILGKQVIWQEWVLLILGTAFVASSIAAANTRSQTTFIVGVAAAVLSTVAGSITLTIVELFHTMPVKLNALDSAVYMSLPAAVLLSPCLALPHVTQNWVSILCKQQRSTDAEVILMTDSWIKLSAMALLSGLFAYFYNILQFYAVQVLSSTQTAFASNISKVAIVVFSVCVLEHLEADGVSPRQSSLVLVSGAGGLGSFLLYSVTRGDRTIGPAQVIPMLVLSALAGGLAALAFLPAARVVISRL